MEFQRLDIVQLINNSPITKLSNKFQTKLLTKIQDSFTDDQQQLFVASFYSYLNFNSKNDFVIDLDDVWKWCGFARIDPAKRVLEKYFTKDIDYKISLHQVVERVHGGQNKQNILMTINTFKKFCLKAGTKKADEIHDYYIKLEELMQETLKEESEELQNKLQEKESMLIDLETEHEDTKRKLEKEKREKHLMQNRRWAHVLPKDTIYVYHDNAKDPESLIKVGKTKDLAQREREYSSFSKSGAIIYYRNVLDCSLAERVCHHLLDSYRVNRKQEWFKVSESVAKEIVDKVALFLDNDLVDKISKETIDSIDEIHETQKKEITFNTDFNKFIDEMCEVNNTHFCFKEDLRMAFRIWSKNTDKKLINDFLEYIKNNFKSGVEHTESLMRRNVWRGLLLKPLEYTIDNENEIKDYEQFILDECEVGYHHRISYHDFFHHYTKWAGIDKLHITKRREIQEYIENKFAGGRVHLSNNTKTTHLHGVWGLSIRGENGMKQKKLTRKSVSQICRETGKILNQWDSLSIAAEHLSMPRSTMSNLARFNRPSGNVYYTYS
jgi:phage anti-repressor protein